MISDFKKERRLDRFSSPQGSSRRAESSAGGWLLCYQRKARGRRHRCASSRKESSVPRCVCAYARVCGEQQHTVGVLNPLSYFSFRHEVSLVFKERRIGTDRRRIVLLLLWLLSSYSAQQRLWLAPARDQLAGVGMSVEPSSPPYFSVWQSWRELPC